MITTSEGFEKFSRQALDRFCTGLAEHTKQHGRLPDGSAVTHFLVQRDPETGEELERPVLRQVEWCDMGQVEVGIAATHFAAKAEAMALVLLRLELEPARVVMLVQHQEGTLDAAVAITLLGDGRIAFGELQELELDAAPSEQYDSAEERESP